VDRETARPPCCPSRRCAISLTSLEGHCWRSATCRRTAGGPKRPARYLLPMMSTGLGNEVVFVALTQAHSSVQSGVRAPTCWRCRKWQHPAHPFVEGFPSQLVVIFLTELFGFSVDRWPLIRRWVTMTARTTDVHARVQTGRRSGLLSGAWHKMGVNRGQEFVIARPPAIGDRERLREPSMTTALTTQRSSPAAIALPRARQKPQTYARKKKRS
jgi:hypothetical protein